MINRAKQSWVRRVVFAGGILAGCSAATLAANTITGVVRNQTLDRFESGAEVIFLRLEHTRLDQASPNQNTREETRTRTDSQGSFTLNVRDPDKPHLVRVVHQGVNYDQLASAGDVVSINVFDAASKVHGVTGSIEIIRIGTAANHLHISDMIEIKNDSRPPLTQAGEHTFEVYLPAQAKIDSALAAGPEKIATLISAAPVPGEPGHYTVNFPLQPEATKFAFNYDLPYDGHAAFRPRNMYPLQQLAVMILPTMKFTSRSPAFQVLRAENDRYQVEAANAVKAGDGPGFEISGFVALPALRAETQSRPNPPVAAQSVPRLSAQTSSRAQGMNGVDTAASSGNFAGASQVQWWVKGTSAVILVIGGFFLWRRRCLSDNAKTKAAQETQRPGEAGMSPLAEALKGELLQLEIDRLLGTITLEEYASAKQALEETVKRALARAGSA